MTGGEFWRAFLALLCTLFLSMSVGIWISSRSRLEHRALAAAAVVICLISFIPLYLDYLLDLDPTTSGAWTFSLFSPWFGFSQATDAMYFLHGDRYWLSLASSVLLGGGFLLTASLTVGGKWQDSDRKESALKRALGAFFRGNQEQRLRFRRKHLNLNPIFWIGARGRVQWQWFMGAVGLILLMIVFYMSGAGDTDSAFGVFSLFNWFFSLIMKILICWLACKAFIEARQNGALELWLCTPLKVDQILDGLRLALKRVWLAALCLMVAVTLSFLAIGLFDVGGTGAGGSSMFDDYQLPTAVIGMVTFIADLIALGWVGMWFGLTSRGVTQAITRTYVMVIIVPWLVISIGWSLLFGLVGMIFLSGRTWFSIEFYFIGQVSLFLLKDLCFFLWARKNLRSQFRTSASEGIKKPIKKKKADLKPPPPPLTVPPPLPAR